MWYDIEIGLSRTFRYLGSVIQEDGGTIEDVTNMIKAGWVKWR